MEERKMKIKIPENLEMPPIPAVPKDGDFNFTNKDVLPPLLDRIPAVPVVIPPTPLFVNHMPSETDDMPPIPSIIPPMSKID
jgi:hypothetical protein